ncbi:MAG: secretin N-terminal domain-containing protein [Candidatus Omnitrophota bacterium]
MKKKLLLTFILAALLYGFVFAQDEQIQEEFVPEDEQVQEEFIVNQQQVQPVQSGYNGQSAQQPVARQNILVPVAANQPVVIANPADKNKITLDIKGMDIVDVLKMLASRASLNVVVGKNVVGRVTLFLKDVDVWDAFEIILFSNDLAYEKTGNIINVMTQRDYELIYGSRFQDKKIAKTITLKYARAADLAKSLAQIKSNLGRVVVDDGSNTIVLIDSEGKIREMMEFITSTDLPIQTRIFNLDYAPADKLSAKLADAVTKGVGSIKIDERTNKIAITDYVFKLDEIAKIITAFDDKTPQVLIDAQIIEVTPSDKFVMGVNWDYWIKKYFRISAALPISGASQLFLGTSSTESVTEPGQYKAILDLLQTIGDTKILASPRIMALNNQEAKIHVGTKEAYITSTTSQAGTGTEVTAQSVNFVDTGIQLAVTPTINRDGFVTMKIKPEISSSEDKTLKSQDTETTVPIVTSSEAETTIMIKDGVTVIIGGLKKEQRTKTVNKIPVLGDIPYLKVLFRNISDEVITKDLVILLTPHIITGEQAFSNFGEMPPREGARAKMEMGDVIVEKVKPSLMSASSVSSNKAYFKAVTEKLSALTAFEKAQGQQGEVEVSFALAKDGSLRYEPKVMASTNQKLNDLAVKSVKSAAPFPAFPVDMSKEEQYFRISLVYK